MPPEEYPIFLQCDTCRRCTKHMLRFDELTGHATELECTGCGHLIQVEPGVCQ